MKLLKMLLMVPFFSLAQGDLEIVEKVIPPSCFGSNDGSVELTNTKGGPLTSYTFKWSNGSNSSKIERIYGGTYSCEVTNENGEVFTYTVDLERPKPLAIGVSTSHFRGPDAKGSIRANVSGGAGYYSYKWSDGTNGNVRTDLLPSEYTLVVSDANNCQLDITIEIKDVSSPVFMDLTSLNLSN